MAKIIYDDIQGIEQSWENYAGSSVEKFIKQQLQNKAGYIYRSQNKEGDYYYLYGFTDYEQYEAWAGGDSSITPLFRVQLPNVENDTFSANLTTNSNTTKIVNLGDGVIIGLKYTSTATNPTTHQTVDTGNDGTLIISRSANGSSYSIVGRVVIQSTPYEQDTYRNFDLTPYLVDGDNKIRLRVEDNVNGSISTNLTFHSVVNTTLAIENATSTSAPLRALQFQYYIQGQVAKTLHVKVSQGALNQTFNYPIGENTYIEVPYTTPLIEMGVESGIIEVDAWITIDDTEVSSYHEISQFYYTDGSSSDTIIILNNVSTDIVNYTNAHLFDMTLYNQGADVEVKIQSTDGQTRYLTLNYNNCQTGVVYPVYATLEIEGNANSIPAMVLVNSANFNCTPYAITIDNSEKMSPVEGADFVLNPKIRNNSETNPNTIINSVNGNVVSSTFTGFGFSNDGWVGDDDNINVLRIPSNHSLQINYDVFDNLRNGTSIELDYKVYNIFNDNDEVIKMYSKNDNQQVLGFVMNATEAAFYTSENQTKRDQDVLFQEGERTHMVINIVPNLANSGLNYIRIFINGILNREMLYSANAVFKTGAVSMIFGSQNCDIDIYGIRVYKAGLSASDVRQNYMSSLPDIDSKVAFKDANNILSANGTISYDKAKVKYNTLVWTGNVPSYSTGDRSYEGSLEINILDDAAHSGNITGLKIKGQGSSSKKYWKWNHQYDWNKDGLETVWTDGNGETHTDGYPLTDNDPAATKLVAKLNWASSMQSHKLGSTALYTDLWKDIVGGNSITATEGYEKVRVSVHEKPFLYFVRETPNSQPVFYGLMTFGSAKYDKPTFGYDKNVFPDYLILEGSDNGKPLTLRQVPWFEDEVPYSDDDEAYLYKNEPNLDYGMGKQENITYFIDAFNFTYLHSPFLVAFTGSIPSDADYKNQYWDTATRNVYRFDYINEEWVNAGATKTNGAYDILNLETQTGLLRSSYSSDADYQAAVIGWRKNDFKNRISTYYNVNDVLYSMAYLKFVAASDNWCKNTYEYLDPVSHKICLAQDDMDTLFLTDNVGRKTKPYYVEEHDLDGENKPYFNGSDNVFFNLMEMAFESEEKNMMRQIFNAMTNRYDSVRNCMQHYYFDVQEYFPAVAYNETARLLYEEASVAQSQGIYDNGTPAISQSLGDQLQAEKQFINKRITYLQSWSSSHPFYVRSTVEPSLNFRSMTTVGGVNPSYRFNLTTWQYLYPKVGTGQYISTDNTRVPARNTYQTINMLADGNTDTFIYGSDYYTSFGEFGGVSLSETFNLNGKRLLEFSADSREVQEYNFRPTSMSVVCPELREFCVYGCSTLAGSLNLSGSKKLTTIDLRGTGLSTVVLPQSDTLTTVYLPNLTSITVVNCPNISTFSVEGYTNLLSLTTDDSSLAEYIISNANTINTVDLRNIEIVTTTSNVDKFVNLLTNENTNCTITGTIYLDTPLTNAQIESIENKFGESVWNSESSFYISFRYQDITNVVLTTSDDVIYPNDSITITAVPDGNNIKSYDWSIESNIEITTNETKTKLEINTGSFDITEYIIVTYTITTSNNRNITRTINILASNVIYTFDGTPIKNHTFDLYPLALGSFNIYFDTNIPSNASVSVTGVPYDTYWFRNGELYIEYNDYDGIYNYNDIIQFILTITLGSITQNIPFSIRQINPNITFEIPNSINCINGYGTAHMSWNIPSEMYQDSLTIEVNQDGFLTGEFTITNKNRYGCDINISGVSSSKTVDIFPSFNGLYGQLCGNNINFDYNPVPKTVNLIYSTTPVIAKIKYNITSTGNNQILSTNSAFNISHVTAMKVDDVSVTPSKTYSFDTTGEHEVEVTINKDSTSANCRYLLTNITTVTELEVENINGNIGEWMCNGCSKLTKFTLNGGTCSTIKELAFSNCNQLTEMHFNNIGNCPTIANNNAFYGVSSRGWIYYPEGVNFSDMFNNMYLNGWNSNYSVINSINYILHEYNNTATVNIPVSTSERYSGNITIPSSVNYNGVDYTVVRVKDLAFADCNNVLTVSLPNTITEIGANAFNGCSKMTTINIPSQIAIINTAVFNNCKVLNTITIPEGVTKINNNAFRGCAALTRLDIPSTVNSIGGGIIEDCTSLTTLTVNSNNSTFKSDNNCVILKANNQLILGCKNSTVPNYVTSIGSNAFSGCTGLTSINIPTTVTSINSAAFQNCTSLTTITIPEGVTSISSSAFNSCTGLTTISLPSTISNISSGAFSNCTKVSTLLINRSSAPTISSSSFGSGTGTLGYNSGTTNTLYVPSGATGYNTTNWTGNLLNAQYGKFTLSDTL